MAEVTGITYSKAIELTDAAVIDGDITSGELILHTGGGTDINLGPVATGIADANTTTKGVVELATDAETITGSDGTRAVTPQSLAAKVATATEKGIVELATTAETQTGTDTVRAVTPAGLAATSQPLDSDLTAIAAIAPANDDLVQRKSGAWTNRTMAQVATDLMATGEFPDVRLHNGSAYVDSDGAHIYVGPTDPGSVTNGSVWFDTTGA